MTSSSAGVTARRAAAQRRRTVVARRRRRLRRAVLTLGGVAAAVLAVTVALPLFETAYRSLTLPLAHEDIIVQQAHEKGLDPALVAGVIYAETKFDARPSSAGAQGLMQILPATAEFLARRSGATTFRVADLGDPQVNIAYGSYYLRYLLDEYHGNVVLALAAYNGGEANVSRWVAEAQADHHSFAIRDIPFPETQAYVLRVLQAQKNYRHTYATQLGYQ
jgi:soluble lytic murein transglycosylase